MGVQATGGASASFSEGGNGASRCGVYVASSRLNTRLV